MERIGELLGAGAAKTGDQLRYVTGSIGPLGTRPSYELMRDRDTLLRRRRRSSG